MRLDHGMQGDARALAEDIVDAQESEIDRMHDLLDGS